MSLTREEILTAIETRANENVPVDVPAWGGTVLLRRLSANDAEKSGLSSSDAETPDKMARVIALSAVDDEGVLLFSEEDVAILTKIDVGAAVKVFTKCIEINGLGSEELDEAVAAFVEAQRDSSSSN